MSLGTLREFHYDERSAFVAEDAKSSGYGLDVLRGKTQHAGHRQDGGLTMDELLATSASSAPPATGSRRPSASPSFTANSSSPFPACFAASYLPQAAPPPRPPLPNRHRLPPRLVPPSARPARRQARRDRRRPDIRRREQAEDLRPETGVFSRLVTCSVMNAKAR